MQQQSTIAIIIMVFSVLLYITEKIPLMATALLSMLAMAFTGCITYAEGFAGFSNVATLMIIGMGIMGEAVFTTGLADRIGKALLKMDRLTEERFVVAAIIVSAFLAAIANAMISMVIFMPIISALSEKTNGKISRKNTYMPIVIAAVFGGNMTVIGSTSMLNAAAMLSESSFEQSISFFGPLPFAIPGLLVCLAILSICGCRLQKRFFSFPEKATQAAAMEVKAEDVPGWKQAVVIADMLACVIAFIAGANYGAVAMLGGLFVIITGCITVEQAMRGVSWSTVLMVVGSLGFAKGVEVSGAGKVIADSILGLCGPLSKSPYAMCVMMLLLATIISNFMSNNATVGVLVPIALSLCMTLGGDPAVYVLACAIGANLSVMTPICNPTVTLTTAAGYRFIDYVRFGGIINVLAFIGTALVMRLYF